MEQGNQPPKPETPDAPIAPELTTEQQLEVMQAQIKRLEDGVRSLGEHLLAHNDESVKALGHVAFNQILGEQAPSSEADLSASEQPTTRMPVVEREPRQPAGSVKAENNKDSLWSRSKRNLAIGAAVGATALAAIWGISKIDSKDTNSANAGRTNTEQLAATPASDRTSDADKGSDKDSSPATTPTASQKLAQSLSGKKNVASILKAANIDSTNDRRFVVKNAFGKNYKVELNNINHKMNAISANSGKNMMIAGIAIAAASDSHEGNQYGKAMVNFNSKNDRDINADTGLTAKQQEAFNEKVMTGEGKWFYKTAHGTYENGYMIDGGEMHSVVENFDGQKILVRQDKDGGTVMFKVTRDKDGKICLNVVRPVETPAPAPAPAPRGGTETPPPAVTPAPRGGGNTPSERPTPGPKGTTKKPAKKPVTGVTGGGVTKPAKKPTPGKTDPNTTPGGVPGQNGGTPDLPGKGPAGQQADPSGFVPGEQHPATPAPEPTPAPLPVSGPEPTGPAETGTPTTAPQEVGQGAGNPTPTTDPVINP